ncbi:hypothetical protein JOM56_007106 [Amanita muscaria]
MGNCPCPRCTVNKQSIRGMGTADDRAVRQSSRRADYKDYSKRVSAARKLIYEDGYVVNSDKVDELHQENVTASHRWLCLNLMKADTCDKHPTKTRQVSIILDIDTVSVRWSTALRPSAQSEDLINISMHGIIRHKMRGALNSQIRL